MPRSFWRCARNMGGYMRLLVSTIIATALGLGAAQAADMARPIYKAQPAPPPITIYNWSGLYIGGQAGGAFSSSDWATDSLLPGLFFNNTHDKDNWIAGGQVGLRGQWGNWVLGVEGMWSATDLQTTTLTSLGVIDMTRTTNIDQLYSVTGQIGYAWDRWLAYAKGGWAGASVDLSTQDAIVGSATSSVSGNASGWTIGGGVEYAFAPSWSFAVEYNYYDLTMDDKSTLRSDGFPVSYIDHDTQIHTIMGRLNYTFNWGKNPGPVMARY